MVRRYLWNKRRTIGEGLSAKEHFTFYSNFMNLTEQYDLSTLGPKSLDNDKIKRYANETLRKNKDITRNVTFK